MKDTSHNSADDIWKNDLIGRKDEAEFIKKYIFAKLEHRANSGYPRSFVLNIDAPWGSGKTQFLESFEKQLQSEGYLVARINAWVDDHSDDPLKAVLAAIESVVLQLPKKRAVTPKLKAMKKNAAKIMLAAAKGFVRQFVKNSIGDAVSEVLGGAAQTGIGEAFAASGFAAADAFFETVGAKYLAEFKEERQALQSFRTSFESLMAALTKANPKHATMFILIDELDRCRPSYAIQTLERVKHLFMTAGAVFVIATDTTQLQHAIRAVYGQGFDSQAYLRRFFDRQYQFKAQSRRKFIVSRLSELPSLELLSLPNNLDLKDYFDRVTLAFELSLRDIEQVIEMLADSILFWPHSTKLQVAYLVPLLILHKKNPDMLRGGAPNTLSEEGIGLIGKVLRFPVTKSKLASDQKELFASELFTELYNRRFWNFRNVFEALSHTWNDFGKPHWCDEALNEEFSQRYPDKTPDAQSVTHLSEYFGIVNSIAGLHNADAMK